VEAVGEDAEKERGREGERGRGGEGETRRRREGETDAQESRRRKGKRWSEARVRGGGEKFSTRAEGATESIADD